jgi:hypothetical protein
VLRLSMIPLCSRQQQTGAKSRSLCGAAEIGGGANSDHDAILGTLGSMVALGTLGSMVASSEAVFGRSPPRCVTKACPTNWASCCTDSRRSDPIPPCGGRRLAMAPPQPRFRHLGYPRYAQGSIGGSRC